MKTAILHLRHPKLSTFWDLTVLYLTATHCHTEDWPLCTYAVTLTFAHIACMCAHSHTIIFTRARTFMWSYTLTRAHDQHMYTHAHMHTHVRIEIYAHATTYTCVYNIRTVCCLLTPTYSRSDMHAQLRTNTCYAHSSPHSRPLTLVHLQTHTWRFHLKHTHHLRTLLTYTRMCTMSHTHV